VLGAAHALTPGHGKTIVAAYLVGSRGTLKHAAFLGAMVTFTHTVSVFLLGLATLFLFQYVMPEKIVQVLGAISGLSIVAIGAWMMYKRIRGLRPVAAPTHSHSHAHDHDHHHEQHHNHDHDHPHTHAHDHEHEHQHSHDHDHHHDHAHSHAHVHSHGTLVHSHGPGGHVHSHAVPDEISWGSLIALGASGGLVPCESALVLLLSAIALGRVGLGLVLLVAFSVGLAVVLMAIGILVLYAKKLIPQSKKPERHPAFRWIPVASAAVVMCVGVLMTGVSLGWLQPRWMI
jgi:ABC-type nickel/cobalt efflux system permease component RcnA